MFVVVIGVFPVGRAARYLDRARESGRSVLPVPVDAQLTNDLYLRAAELDKLDPTPCSARAQWLMAVSDLPELREQALRLAAESIDQAIERDPLNIRLHGMRMRLYQTRASYSGDPGDYLAAVAAARSMLSLYPANPSGLASLADCQAAAGEAMGSGELLEDAVSNYERALELDEARLPWERLHRFRPREKEAIQAGIQRARDLLQRDP